MDTTTSGGRPRALNPGQVETARTLLADRTRPIADVCGALHVSRATLYRYVTTRPARVTVPCSADARPLHARRARPA